MKACSRRCLLAHEFWSLYPLCAAFLLTFRCTCFQPLDNRQERSWKADQSNPDNGTAEKCVSHQFIWNFQLLYVKHLFGMQWFKLYLDPVLESHCVPCNLYNATLAIRWNFFCLHTMIGECILHLLVILSLIGYSIPCNLSKAQSSKSMLGTERSMNCISFKVVCTIYLLVLCSRL